MHWFPYSGVAKCITKKGVENIRMYMDLSKCLVSLMLEFKHTKQLLVGGLIHTNLPSAVMS